jgi:hypothetical protein
VSLLLPKSISTHKEEIIDFSYVRPIGVSVLAVLMLVSSAISFILELVYLEELVFVSGLFGITQTGLLTILYVLAVIGMAAGAGLWLGKSWGWWLTLFYFAFFILRNGNVLLFSMDTSIALGSVSSIVIFVVKPVLRALGGGVALYYLFKENPLIYFCLPETLVFKLKALGLGFGTGLVIVVLFAWIKSGAA